MNLLFVADVPFKNPTSGAPKVLYERSVRLAKKHTISVITRITEDEPLIEEKVNGVVVYRYYVNRSNAINFIRSSIINCFNVFNRLLVHNNIQLIVFHQPISAFIVNLSPKSWNIPKVYTFFSPAFKEYETKRDIKKITIKMKSGSLALKWVEKFCLSRCNKIIVLSEFSKRQLIEYHKIPVTKIHIIPAGVDTKRFIPASSPIKEIREKLNLPRDKFILFTLRNLIPRMGLETLLEAMALIVKQNTDIYLVVGGTGVLEKKLKLLVGQLNLNNYVRMEGFIPDEQLLLYYQSADLFVLPSKFLEGFGLITLEALACGLPVLGTPVGGTIEILGKLDANLLFSNTDAYSMAEKILEFYHSRSHLSRSHLSRDKLIELSNYCREFVVANYSWDMAELEQLLLAQINGVM
ncbi:MAG: glycosyltransferase family 4 protein [Candidatus Stahlbacteria bacterium]|nr:glycosyltransferase family 4 protein [Candidatus Stahlbacteria bacterium]